MYPAHRALIEICRVVRPPRPVASLEIQLARRYADWYVNTVKRDASLAEQDRTARELVADIHTKHTHQYFDEGTLADRECCIAINRDLGFATAPENDLWMSSINTQWLAEAQAATTATSALAGFQLVTSVRIPPKIAHYCGSQLDAWLHELPPCPDLKQTVASHVSCYFFPWTQHRKRSGPGGQARIALLDRTTVSPTHIQCRSSDILLNVVAFIIEFFNAILYFFQVGVVQVFQGRVVRMLTIVRTLVEIIVLMFIIWVIDVVIRVDATPCHEVARGGVRILEGS